MKRPITVAFVVLACVTLLASIAIVTPKAVRAAVATLVQDVDNPGRHVFHLSCFGQAGCGFTVPANQKYVIQTVSALAPNSGSVLLQATTSGSVGNYVFNLTNPLSYPLNFRGSGQVFAVTIYADANSEIGVSLPVILNGGGEFIDLLGYSVTNP